MLKNIHIYRHIDTHTHIYPHMHAHIHMHMHIHRIVNLKFKKKHNDELIKITNSAIWKRCMYMYSNMPLTCLTFTCDFTKQNSDIIG